MKVKIFGFLAISLVILILGCTKQQQHDAENKAQEKIDGAIISAQNKVLNVVKGETDTSDAFTKEHAIIAINAIKEGNWDEFAKIDKPNYEKDIITSCTSINVNELISLKETKIKKCIDESKIDNIKKYQNYFKPEFEKGNLYRKTATYTYLESRKGEHGRYYNNVPEHNYNIHYFKVAYLDNDCPLARGDMMSETPRKVSGTIIAFGNCQKPKCIRSGADDATVNLVKDRSEFFDEKK